VKETFVDLLVCPETKAPFKLEVKESRGGEIVSGGLVSTGTGRRYPIIDGIPRILNEDELEMNYASNFYYYWTRMDWRVYHESTRFWELTEWKPEDLRGKFILDAGCGGGRWLYHMARAGGRMVALDYTRAIEKARQECKDFKDIDYVQGDIFKLPFKESLFDIVHCHGVLMATPSPERGVKHLARMVKPGGELAVLLYHELSRPQRIINRMLRSIPKRLPRPMAFYLSLVPTATEYVPGTVWLLGNIIHLSGQRTFTMKWLHNFDWYTCEYHHRTPYAELKKWYEEVGFEAPRELDTNEFRKRSRFAWMRNFRKSALENNLFLKATIGVRGIKRK